MKQSDGRVGGGEGPYLPARHGQGVRHLPHGGAVVPQPVGHGEGVQRQSQHRAGVVPEHRLQKDAGGGASEGGASVRETAPPPHQVTHIVGQEGKLWRGGGSPAQAPPQRQRAEQRAVSGHVGGAKSAVQQVVKIPDRTLNHRTVLITKHPPPPNRNRRHSPSPGGPQEPAPTSGSPSPHTSPAAAL